MLKFLSVLILVTAIAASLAFILIKTASLGSLDNWFNLNYRSEVAEIPLLRQILGLNLDGDAKTDYLSRERDNIVVEVDTVAGLAFSPRTLEIAEAKMEQITGKQVTFIESSQIPEPAADDFELRQLYDTYKIHKATDVTAVFYLLYAVRNKNRPGVVGETLQEDGAVLFAEDIINLKSNNLAEIEASTILHEFGHQLGLPHVSVKNCIMNETLEVGGRLERISTEFCEEELELINQIKNLLFAEFFNH